MRYGLFFLLMLLDADLIRSALRHADISLVKAALWMEMDPALLERQLSGEGHLSHKRLLKLPLKFHRWFAVLAASRYGLPSELKRAVPLELALLGHRRMRRMDLQQAKQQRRIS